jgi:hypothetical protein
MEHKHKKEFHNFESYQPQHQKVDLPTGTKTARVNAWLKHHWKLVLVIIIVVVSIIGGSLAYLFSKLQYEVVKPTATHKKAAAKLYSPLTGVETDEANTKRPVTAIMIENSPEARPQSGLKDGGVVFEAIAEAGITRFLVLYQEVQPQLIGPVRSVRPYYIDWLAAFDPSVAHVGGSANALKEVRNGSYKDIDQFFNADTYWRVKDRYAPHNVYTSFAKIDSLNKKKGYTSSNFTAFTRKEDAGSKTPNATTISVPISSALFNSSYTYEPQSNSYLRSQAGKPHTDREGGQINPKVVVVIEAPMSIVMEDGAREQIQTIGSGAATIFQDGQATSATWSKTSKKNQLSFKNADGKAIAFNRGQVWFTVIPTGKTPSWQ